MIVNMTFNYRREHLTPRGLDFFLAPLLEGTDNGSGAHVKASTSGLST